MFLTTEPSLVGKNYNTLRVLSAISGSDSKRVLTVKEEEQQLDANIENALGKLHAKATTLGADGVIGVHFNISFSGGRIYAIVMGTAIKIF